MWECPDFFPIGNKHVLLISTMGKVRWKVGTYSDQRFTPEKEGVVDWGAYYAAKTMLDANGNRILWGWIPETRRDTDLIAAGWAGAMSLPRTVSLDEHNEFQTEVAPAVQVLRASHTGSHRGGTVRQQALAALKIYDLAAELDVTIQPKNNAFTLRLQSDSGNFTAISCSNQSGGRELRVNTVTVPLSGDSNAPVHLHMYLDGSVLEVFAGKAVALTSRVYQIPSGPLSLRLDGPAELTSLDLWPMKPISKDRLTGSLCS